MHYLMDLDNTLLDTYYTDENGKHCFRWTQDFEKDFQLSVSVVWRRNAPGEMPKNCL